MNKIYLAAIAAVLAGGSASAQTGYQITTSEEAMNYGGQQAMAISANGAYIVGQSYNWETFVYTVASRQNRYFTIADGSKFEMGSAVLNAVSDNGIAVGFDDNGAIIVDIVKDTYTVFEKASRDYPYIDANDITPDGTLIVGGRSNSTFYPTPCYWIDGTRYDLPYPTTTEAGFTVYGASAYFVSDDGSIIIGTLLNGLDPYPMIIWKRGDDGTYAYTDTYKRFYEPKQDLVWGPDMIPSGVDRGPNPFIRFSPGALTSDGKYVAMAVIPNTEEIFPPRQLAYFNIEEETVELVPVNPDDLITFYEYQFSIGGISDDLTIVGSAGEMGANFVPFILYHDDMEVQKLADVFPTVPVIQDFDDYNTIEQMWELATDITPDGRYIIGYIADPDNYAGLSFLLDTEAEEDGVGTLRPDAEAGEPVFYGVDGRRVDNPDRGIYVKIQGGKAEKVIL